MLLDINSDNPIYVKIYIEGRYKFLEVLFKF